MTSLLTRFEDLSASLVEQITKYAGISEKHAQVCDLCDFVGARGRVVYALDPRSRGLGLDSRSTGHVYKPWASFESTSERGTRWNEN